ncbi:heme oxygenase [Tenacibaculum sp. SZ-18]|uniref:DUF3050 domain-containing protein n=1 Tax=Tenacibaculum sp. SZ-18 TaxID=754423 RepID=UPI000C2D42D4|nr:DUF3050 domain-containing protein [Tenacibaculum sp. SZ-18]AUC14741.1 heme oxygenase [Tenacibaculum sp. SZ-18]
MSSISYIEEELEDLRIELREHKLYASLQNLDDVKIFMESHVFAVWDFMSLLKALQRELTCVSLPWFPKVNTKTARFINEIVLAEETDVNELGEPRSHFEMYVDAMKQIGASTSPIANFISEVYDGTFIEEALQKSDINEAVKDFISFTFEVIKTHEAHLIASVFTFGREDLIPDMFLEIVKNTEEESNVHYSKLTYYLKRHIELDGDDHGPLSLEMMEELCGEDQQKWEDVLFYAKKALKMRIHLWNGITQEINESTLV